MMRIVHVIDSLDPARGGPPVVCTSLAVAQAMAGHEVTILYGDEPGGKIAYPAWASRELVKLVTTRTQGTLASHLGIGATAEMQNVLGSADVVHTHGIWTSLITIACTVALRRRIPYVITPHGMLDPWSMSQKRLKKRIVMALRWKTLIDGALFVHALNVDERRLMEPLKLKAPIEVIANGMFPDDSPEVDDEAFRAACPGVRDRRYILFLSRLHLKKGIDYLVAAFAIIAADYPGIDLVIAGPDDGYLQELNALVESTGLGKRVHLPGPLYGAAKMSALAGATCFCLPSRQEGFSIAILEALMSCTPVVISDACHFPEVQAAGAGVATQLTTAAVADGLRKVLSLTEGQRSAMGEAGRRLVLDNYTWPRIADRTIATYEARRAVV